MKNFKLLVATVFLLLSYQNLAYGQDAPKANYAYFSLEPNIVTNFLSNSSQKLGFVTVAIELMLENAEYLEAAEHHSPLMRATVIEVFGRQTAEKVKSLTGREDIRRNCLEKLREVMRKETGENMIKEVIFIQYRHHN
jgi:flagellar FliL protein